MASIKSKAAGHWRNVKDDCMLCDMEKKTHWWVETPRLVIAEKLGGGPFVVWKEHKAELSADEWEAVRHTCGIVFDEFELEVIMAHCSEHHHAHLRNYEFAERFK